MSIESSWSPVGIKAHNETDCDVMDAQHRLLGTAPYSQRTARLRIIFQATLPIKDALSMSSEQA